MVLEMPGLQNMYQKWSKTKLRQFTDVYNKNNSLNIGDAGFLDINDYDTITNNIDNIIDYYSNPANQKIGRNKALLGFLNPLYQYVGMNWQKQREFADGLARLRTARADVLADGRDLTVTEAADQIGHAQSKGATAALKQYAISIVQDGGISGGLSAGISGGAGGVPTASDFSESGEFKILGLSLYGHGNGTRGFIHDYVTRNATVSSEISSAAIDAVALSGGAAALASWKARGAVANAVDSVSTGNAYVDFGKNVAAGAALGMPTRALYQAGIGSMKRLAALARRNNLRVLEDVFELGATGVTSGMIGTSAYGAATGSMEHVYNEPDHTIGKPEYVISDVANPLFFAKPVLDWLPGHAPDAHPAADKPDVPGPVSPDHVPSPVIPDAAPAPDADLDGFTSDVDCNDDNPLVNPGMDEIPGNGIDDNCDGRIDESVAGPAVPDKVPDAPKPVAPDKVPETEPVAPAPEASKPGCEYTLAGHQWQDAETELKIDYRPKTGGSDNIWYGIRDVNLTEDCGLAVHLNDALASEADYVRILVDSNSDGKIGAGDSSFFVDIDRSTGYATLDQAVANYDWESTRFQISAVDTDGLSIDADCHLEGRLTYLSSVDSKGLDLSTGYLKPAPVAPVDTDTTAVVPEPKPFGETLAKPIDQPAPPVYAPTGPLFDPNLVPEKLIIVNNFDECQTLDHLYDGPGHLRITSLQEVPELTRIANLGIADKHFMTMPSFEAPDGDYYSADFKPWDMSDAQNGDNLTHVYFAQAQVVDGDHYDNVSFLFQAKDPAPNDMLGMSWDRGFWMHEKDLGTGVEELTLNKNDLFRVYTHNDMAEFANVYRVGHVGDDWQQHSLTPLDLTPLQGDVKEQVGHFKGMEKFELTDKPETGSLENILNHKVEVGFNRTGSNAYMVAGYDLWDGSDLVRDVDFIMVNGGRSEPEVVFTTGFVAGAGLTWLLTAAESASTAPIRNGGEGVPGGGGGSGVPPGRP